ncbi:MAG: hypothetical protein IPK55_11295 [Streptococcus sp.]|nr:hypothetical protein [Streptococcus sp.]
MLNPLYEVKQSKEALLKSGVLEFVVKFALKVADYGKDREPDDRIAALNILTEIWLLYTTPIEKEEKITS